MPPGVAVSLLRARTRHAGRRWLIVSAGLALATVLPVLAQAVMVVTADAALQRGLSTLPPGRRSVIVSYNGLPGAAEVGGMDATVRAALPRLTAGPVHRQLIFREINDVHGNGFVLGAADALPTEVRLVSGRMPRSCTPTRCEVVALRQADPGPAAVPEPELGLIIVGTVVRTDPLLLTGTFDPGPGKNVLLADGVLAAAANRALAVFGRSYGWVAPFDLTRVHADGVDGWLAAGAQVADELWRVTPGLVLTTPDQVLRDQDARARASARRFGVLGGATSVLLVGTAVVGGAALRRDHEAFVGALRRRGASRRQLVVLTGGEAGLAAGAAALLGLVLAAVAAGSLAGHAGLPVASTAGHALGAALPAVAGLAVLSAVLLALTLTVPAGPAGTAPAGVWWAGDALALGCLAAAALLAGRGAVGVGGTGGGGDPLLVALPVLVLVAVGLLLARAWPPITRLVLGRLPRRAVAARLGLAGAGGRPLRPVTTAALLTAAVAAAVFAGAYRATLLRGAADQAAYRVPMDARVQVGSTLERPLDLVPPAVLARQAPAAVEYPVARAAGSVRVSAQQGEPIQLVGLDPAALPRLTRWDAVAGGGDPTRLAALLAVPALPTGIALPAGSSLVVATAGPVVSLAVTASVVAADGREAGVPLAVRPAAAGRGAALAGRLPDLRTGDGSPAALRLVALTARQPPDQASRLQHALGEGRFDLAVPAGTIELGGVSVDGVAVAAPWAGWAGSGLAVAAGSGSARLDYRLTSGSVTLQARPTGPGTDSPLPVLTDPATAASASGGLVTIILDQSPVTARVVGVLPRFPTVDGRFAVADRRAVSRLEDLATPGSGEPSELWIDAGPGGGAALAAALAAPPFDRLDVLRQASLAAGLRADPVARAASGLLAAGALLTLLVALLAVALLVVTERYDEAAQTYAWEADGVAPATLRMALWWRAAAVAGPAVPAGVLAGVALSRVTARLVAVTATATPPQPPLVAGTGAGWAVAVAAVGLVGVLLPAGLVAWRSLREPLPVRGPGVAR